MLKTSNIFCRNLLLVVMMAWVSDAVRDPEIVPRSAWGARDPKEVQRVTPPVPYVVIHHSHTPAACNTTKECAEAMRWMQDFHQFNRTWWDIGYNFASCGDGKIYEGRGWGIVGAHAPSYNNISVGICIIGDWRTALPPENQLSAAQQLIAMGVREGLIAEDYRLVGHRQVRAGTDCPGDRLYEEIKGWAHYDPAPDHTKLGVASSHSKSPHSKATPTDDNIKLQKLGKRAASMPVKLS